MPSSVIKSFKYDGSSRILVVEFYHGGVYEYANVPARLYEEMRAAFSKGSFFQARIRDHFLYRRKPGSPDAFDEIEAQTPSMG